MSPYSSLSRRPALLLQQVWREVPAMLKAPHKAVTEPKFFITCSCLLLLVEAVILVAIIQVVPYTEIDWKAYMQEVGGFLNGTLDYSQLLGDTGPLVYPAGFVYVYSALYYVTGGGENVRLAQLIFAALYLATLTTVLAVYHSVGQSSLYPPYLLVFLGCTAYRIHSIFVLRLFNDPVAMFLLYAATLLFVKRRWTLGCAVYSLAVSIKMNVILFAPGLLVLLVLSSGWEGTLPRLALCAAVQLLLGAPFLWENPVGYVNRAFDLRRQFLYEWTVNWRCIPEWLFLNRAFHLVLLVAHVLLLVIFTVKHWTRSAGVKSLFQWRRNKKLKLTNSDIVWTLFTSNLIGMIVARSLHYQFYVWYFHSLPLLLWTTRLHPLVRAAVLVVIECCWNTYPSTVLSSLLLHTAHTLTLSALLLSPGTHSQHLRTD